jgi:monoamine oxidase
MVEACDVVNLGAGPAGIAAARSLRKQRKSVVVLEVRSRVGGRTFTSDSLGVNFPLDDGAKWIHEGCPENCILQVWRELDQHGDSHVHQMPKRNKH